MSDEDDRVRTDPAPRLSVVVGARTGESPPGPCLDALAGQVGDGIEVILVEDRDSGAGPAWVRRIVRVGGLVPELWAEGLRHASGGLVGLLASTVVPDPDWVARTLELHSDDGAAVGGAIEPGHGLRVVDWAVYFCRYAPYMLPLAGNPHLEIPGDNASYRADVLASYQPLYEHGFWEPAVHRAMRADGHQLRMSPERVVRHQAGATARGFCRQRFSHGRAHGRRRSTRPGPSQILRAVVSAPLVPPLLTLRAARTVVGKRRLHWRFACAAPFVLAFSCSWAAGELLGALQAATRQRDH